MKYFDLGQWPIYFGFTTSEKAFHKELKRLGCGHAIKPFGGGATTHLFEGSDGGLTVIVTLHEWRGHNLSQVAGLVAHEAVHVAQALWEHIGEKNPSPECEAYFVQHVVQLCLEELKDFKKKAA